jgi:hypothetical protein
VIAVPRWTLIAAIYLDFILFSIPWAYIEYAYKPQLPFKLVAFAVIEFLAHKIIDRSPGKWLMRAPHQHPFVVFVGIFIMLEGTKTLVRWSMWTPPTPFFGGIVSAEMWPWFSITHGIVECVIAGLFLRGHLASGPASIAYFGTTIGSVLTSWDLWDAWVAEMIVRRRAYQGLPVREGEIARMQAATPEMVIGGMILFLVLSLIAWGVILVRRRREEVTAPPEPVRSPSP